MRRKVSEELVAWKNREGRKPLILKGARQVGKTFILRDFGNTHFRKTHYLNFEKQPRLHVIFEKDLDPQRILEELSFHLKESIDLHKDLVIFDEIQECPKALTSLKYFQEEMPELALASAGSLLGVHLNQGSFPVGKVDFLSLYPMDFEEFLAALGEEVALTWMRKRDVPLPDVLHEQIWEWLKWYFVVGGLPEVVKVFLSQKERLFEAFESARKVQKGLIFSYNSDMAKHAGKVNAMHLSRLWEAVPHQLAREVDGSIPRFRFKDVIPGVNRYSQLIHAIDWLEAAGLIIKVKITTSGTLPFSAHASENSFKLLLFDVGLLGALSELSPETLMEGAYGSYKGYFAENFVAQEFYAKGISPLYSWQEKQAEVDFLKDEKGVCIPIEVKSGETARAKSLVLFQKKYHSPYRVLLSGQNLFHSAGLRSYPLYMAQWSI